MSNHKIAYGWSGHILVSRDETKSNPDDNLIAVDPGILKAIYRAAGDMKLDPRIGVERLGIINTDYLWLACGHPSTFSEGFTHYGTVFEEAEMRGGGSDATPSPDVDYRSAMLEIYKLDLPPCRMMIGCSSEH